MASSAGNRGGKSGTKGPSTTNLSTPSATDRLTFMEETLADNPSISPYFIKFVNGTPTVIDIDAFEDERLTANDLKSIDNDGGAIPIVLMRMSATDGKIANKTISGELCELLTAGRLGLPNHPTCTVASPDAEATTWSAGEKATHQTPLRWPRHSPSSSS